MKNYIIELIVTDMQLTENRKRHLIQWVKESGDTAEYYPRRIKADQNRIEFANKIKDILTKTKD
ncbi:MAG: hypothetical protein ACUZ8E_07025 [Candidatus Anammoxibacter sp.]